jgi:hypothetical protein
MGNKESVRKGEIRYENMCTEELGRKSMNNVSFDDQPFLFKKYNFRLSEVKIWHDSSYIVGIQGIYEMDGTKKTPGTHSGTYKNAKCTSLELAPGEHITKIMIRSGGFIDSIELTTTNKRSLKVGGSGGSPTLFESPPGYQFISFAGSTATYLETIYIHFDKIY